MSRENVERLRDAGQRGQRDPELFFALMDPEVDWASQMIFSVAGTGVDAVRRFYREWFGSFHDLAFEWEEMLDAGDAVVTVTRWHGTGKASGVTIEQLLSQVWTFRDGRIVRYRDFATRSEAVEAAGCPTIDSVPAP
jgi:ketosteroid isomerase-like protein